MFKYVQVDQPLLRILIVRAAQGIAPQLQEEGGERYAAFVNTSTISSSLLSQHLEEWRTESDPWKFVQLRLRL